MIFSQCFLQFCCHQMLHLNEDIIKGMKTLWIAMQSSLKTVIHFSVGLLPAFMHDSVRLSAMIPSCIKSVSAMTQSKSEAEALCVNFTENSREITKGSVELVVDEKHESQNWRNLPRNGRLQQLGEHALHAVCSRERQRRSICAKETIFSVC